MLRSLEKSWPLISILLLFILLAVFLLWPTGAGTLGIILLILGPGMAIFFAVRRQVQAYQAARIDRRRMMRNIVVDVTGILFTIALAIFLARRVLELVGPLVGGGIAGVAVGILAAVLVGVGAGIIVQATWGRVWKSGGD